MVQDDVSPWRGGEVIDTQIRGFIDAQRVARLATVDGRGRPHVVPICFALGDGDVLYTAIDEKPKTTDVTRLRRLRNIIANPNVQVLVDVYNDGDWSRLRYVQLRGRARILGPDDEQRGALALLRDRYTQYMVMGLEKNPVIAVDIERVVDWP
ncbi:MAG TPA: TIGR03668 family PPOX class F420-dependent oxidoreductase [Dehalococcoidia bacterium]|nr:TIGR03668 family PPOX class F420-dependent oxidoreductase [Dehalococcoidia bacterium]